MLVAWLALLAAGCGGGGGTPTASKAGPTSASSSAATTASRIASVGGAAYSVVPRELVTMRQYSPESLIWQTVSINADGAGRLTSLIGEISGAKRRSFQLPASDAARLRTLVAGARSVRPPPGTDPRAELYTLHISGEPSANIQGAMPVPLAALVHFLSGLMLQYCC